MCFRRSVRKAPGPVAVVEVPPVRVEAPALQGCLGRLLARDVGLGALVADAELLPILMETVLRLGRGRTPFVSARSYLGKETPTAFVFGDLLTGNLTGPCESDRLEAGPSIRWHITIVVLAIALHLVFLHLILREVRLVYRVDDVLVHVAKDGDEVKPP